MEHLDTFLLRHPPFASLDPELVREVATEAAQRTYRSGEIALVEDGAPAAGLWVILTGSMDIVHEGEAIQVLEPGECFGHPSLLTGMAPAFTIRAREESTCAILSPDLGRRVLGTPSGAAYVARTMRKRLTRAGHTVHGLLDVGTTPVSAIMRPVQFCQPDDSVRDVAVASGRGSRLGAARLAGRGRSRRDHRRRDPGRGSRRSPDGMTARGSPGLRYPRPRSRNSPSRRRSTCWPPAARSSRCSTARACAGCCPPPICSAWTPAARSHSATGSWARPTRTRWSPRWASSRGCSCSWSGPACPRATSAAS